MRSFLSVTDFSTEELSGVLDRADELHDLWHERRMPQSLVGRRIALWFVGQGFRNRLAFELGARSMGADVSTVPGELGVQEPNEDVGHYLANWFDARAAGSVATSDSLGRIDASVDLIYTDCWPRDGDADAVCEAFAAYRITREVVDAMGEGFFLPCLPVTRGEEVTAAALDAPVCRNYAAKEFLLHAQNALMELAFAE